MANVKFFIQKKSENSQIYVRFFIGKKIDFTKKTNLFINSKDWSDKTNLPKPNTETNKALKYKLEVILSPFIKEQYNKDSTEGEIINSDWLTSIIDKCFNRVEVTDLDIFTNYIQRIIDKAPFKKNKTGGIGLSASTIKNYKMFKNIILNYEKSIKKVLKFSDINPQFIEDFTEWLLVKKLYSKNYAGRQLEFIKTTCLDAEKNELNVTKSSTKLETFRLSDKERYIHTLSFKDLDKIFNTEMPTPHLKEVKKWILFGSYIGQRGGDLLNLTTENIRLKDNAVYIDLVQQKTEKFVTIPVLKDYVIDIVLNEFPKNVSFKKINPHIQKVCELSGIDEVVTGYAKNEKKGNLELTTLPKYKFITSHSFRRSFASNFYKKIPTPVLMGITGHSEERMFLKYINRKADKDTNADSFALYYGQMMKKEEPVLRVLKSSKG
ncbi:MULTISPECIES: tyrosine-type recombinase/integrase [unclassified Empedobacter]|uniref:tyrosine-type recombinase/integrase n=1 Tax=unclassified Empedobacter TaxID=2643773 RepID=UPI0025C25CCB|nr:MULTISPECIES: phage integrase SAM-like domain-containing protein [unclassified Empedobacter]